MPLDNDWLMGDPIIVAGYLLRGYKPRNNSFRLTMPRFFSSTCLTIHNS